MASATQGCDFVLETIPEVLDTKKMIFSQLDQLPPEVIIASNTSSFTMDMLTENLKSPQTDAGTALFSTLPISYRPWRSIREGTPPTRRWNRRVRS